MNPLAEENGGLDPWNCGNSIQPQLYRLVGVGSSNFKEAEEPTPLFTSGEEFGKAAF